MTASSRSAFDELDARPEHRDAPGPIYIGGLERSGKTTMQAFLTSHPRISIPGVGSNMWTYFYRRFGDLGRQDNLDRCLHAMLTYSHVAYLSPDEERIRKEFGEGPTTYARLFALFLIHYAERQGKPRWGAQTGLIERYAPELFASYPGVKIIHMVRDPRDRYEASLALWPNGKGRAGAATARWNYSLRLAHRHARRHPQDYLVIRYEDLVRYTEHTLRAVCAFLGESFSSAMLTMSGAVERRQRLIQNAAVEAPEKGLLSDRFIGRFATRLSPTELAFIQLHTRRGMRRLGYSPAPVDLSLGERANFIAHDWPLHLARMGGWRGREWLQQRLPNRFARSPDPKSLVSQSARSVT